MDNWISVKPENDHEFSFLTASWCKGSWEIHLWHIIKISSADGSYYGLIDHDNNEWGDYSDLNAELYKVIELPSPPKNKNNG